MTEIKLHMSGTLHGKYITKDGTETWYEHGKVHKLDGPAVVWPNGTQRYYQNGITHRLDGPAIIHADGGREWWQNGKRHRLDGPAVIWENGAQLWYQHGLLHRLDGPARIPPIGSKREREWCVNDKEITDQVEEWIAKHNIKLPFSNEAQIEFLLRFF